MSSKRVAGRVVVSFILIPIAISASPGTGDKPVYAAADVGYHMVAGAKVVRIAHPGDPEASGARPSEGFAAADTERRSLEIRRGQTLADILHAAGVPRLEAARATKALSGQVDLRALQIGQRVTLYLAPRPRPEIAKRLFGLALDLGRGRDAVLFQDFDGRFSVRRLSHQAALSLLDSIVVVAADEGESGFITRDLVLRKGQNLNRLLIEGGAAADDGHAAANKIGERVDLRRLQVGQRATATFETYPDGRAPRLAGVALTLPGGRVAVVGRDEHDRWRDGPAALAGAPAAETAELPVVVALGERPPAAAASGTATVVLDRGDILFDRLVEAGASPEEATRAVKDLARVLNLRKLQIGEEFRLTFAAPADGGPAQLIGLSVTSAGKNAVVLGWPLVESGSAAVADAHSPSVTHVAPADDSQVGDAGLAEPTAEAAAPAATDARVLEIARGDNLSRVLAKAGASRGDIGRAMHALRQVTNPNRLKVGQRLVVEFDRKSAPAELVQLTLETGANSAVTVERIAPGRYAARKEGADVLKAAIAYAGARGRMQAVAPGAALAHAGAVDPEALEARVNGYRTVDLEAGTQKSVTLARGGTLLEALVEAGSTPPDAHAAIESVRELYNPRRLQAGQTVALTFVAAPAELSLFGTPVKAQAGDGPELLGGVSLDVSLDKRLHVVRLEDGRFVSGFVAKDLVSDLRRVDGTIESSLYEAIVDAGVPLPVMMDMIRIFSFDVDFQRDLHEGDRFELMYEMLVDEAGEPVKASAILFAALELSGKVKELYRYRMADGRFEYFDADGRSVRKALLRTPVDSARLSSGFGMRKHPILGYSRMHQGVDFAAPRGTPVYAAGEGVVERASRYGAYGNYVRIRHNTDYATAYAHLTSFASGIYPGKRVAQGETIGFVGATGRSTGPHLHYEVLRRGAQVNPLSVKLPTGIKLADSERTAFLAERKRLRNLYAELPDSREVAARER